MKLLHVIVVLSVFLTQNSTGADVPVYTVKRITAKIVIDGVLDDEDWEAAEPVGDFKFPRWTEGEKEQTKVKMLWDDQFLYVSFTCEDKHIWADHYDTNSQTFKDDCVELFWNPNPEAGISYNMFEMNCTGNLLSVVNYNMFEQSIHIRDSRIMVPHIAQSIDGTVNNDEDIDTGWVLEIAIRFSDYPELSKRLKPITGDMWRVGLNRCGGKTNPQYSQWSPSSTPKYSFHSPNDFGEIYFSDEPVQ